MALTATINLDVAPLSDTDVWFANSAAWNTYWNAISGTVTMTPAATTTYVPQPYDENLGPLQIVVDGVASNVPTQAMFDSLLAYVTILEQSYQNLRTQLYDAGYIDHA